MRADFVEKKLLQLAGSDFSVLVAVWRSVRLTPDASNRVVSLSTCGVLYDTTESTAPACSAYLAIVVLLGALAGYLVARVRIPSVGATPGSSSEAKPPTIFWWAFGAGLLFDLIFVFVYLYIGQ